MMMVVRRRMATSLSSASWTIFSDLLSNAEVASSCGGRERKKEGEGRKGEGLENDV